VQLSTWKSEAIVINNMDPTSFALMLKFMYTGKADLCVRTAINLFYACQRFEVFALMDICRQFVLQEVLHEGSDSDGDGKAPVANHFAVLWWPLYKLSADLGWVKLKNACFVYAANNLRQFVELGVPMMYVHARQTSQPKQDLGSDQGRQIEAKLLITVLQLCQKEEIEIPGAVQLRAVAQWLTACAGWQQAGDATVLRVLEVLPWRSIDREEVQEMLTVFPILQHIPMVASKAEEGQQTPQQSPQQPSKKRSRTYAGSIHLADAARTFPSEERLKTYARYKYEKHTAGTGYPDFMLPKRGMAHSTRKTFLKEGEVGEESVLLTNHRGPQEARGSKVLFDSAHACRALPGFGKDANPGGKGNSKGVGSGGTGAGGNPPAKSPKLKSPAKRKVSGKRGKKSGVGNAGRSPKKSATGNAERGRSPKCKAALEARA
jgi:hypothetical protein